MAFLRHLLNFVLWPVADCHWQKRIKKRRLLMRLTFVDNVLMSPDGTLTLAGNILNPVRLQANGTVRVGNDFLRPGRPDKIERPDPNALNNPDQIPSKVPWLEWYGNLLIIETVDHRHQIHHDILTFEHGGWLQWQISTDDAKQPTFLHSLWVDLDSSRHLGSRFLGKLFSVGWRLAIIFWIAASIAMFFYVQEMRRESLDELQEESSHVQEDVE